MLLKIFENIVFAFLGVFSVFLIKQTNKIGWRELIGYPLLVTILALLFSEKLIDATRETSWGISGISGFTVAFFKVQGVLKVLLKGIKGTKTLSENIIDVLDKQIEDDAE